MSSILWANTDIYIIYINSDTHSDSSTLDITMQGTVGFLTPRLAGDRPHLAYYVSPYDLIDTSANNKITLKDKGEYMIFLMDLYGYCTIPFQ